MACYESALVDSGSYTSIIHEDLLNKLAIKFDPNSGRKTLRLVNGGGIDVLGIATLIVKFNGR